MSQGSISASQFRHLLAAPPYVSAAWKTFELQMVDARSQMSAKFTDHVLSLVIAGSHDLRQRVEGQTFEGRSHPGDLCFVPADLGMSSEGTASPRVLVLFVPGPFLSRVITEHWDTNPDSVEMLWRTTGG